MPTSYETFSLVTFEAAASGLPLLATPVNSRSASCCRTDKTASSSSAAGKSIAARLRELAADGGRMAELGAAREAALCAFSWGRTVERHHELYQRLAGELGVPSP